jgi:hypothetical protein
MLFMGKYTISMVIFNSYVKLPEGILVINSYYTCGTIFIFHEHVQEKQWITLVKFLTLHYFTPWCQPVLCGIPGWILIAGDFRNFSEHPSIFQSITEIPTKTCFNVGGILTIFLMYLNSFWRVNPHFQRHQPHVFPGVGSKNQVTLLTPGDMRWLFCSGYRVPSSFVTMPGFPGCLARFLI